MVWEWPECIWQQVIFVDSHILENCSNSLSAIQSAEQLTACVHFYIANTFACFCEMSQKTIQYCCSMRSTWNLLLTLKTENCERNENSLQCWKIKLWPIRVLSRLLSITKHWHHWATLSKCDGGLCTIASMHHHLMPSLWAPLSGSTKFLWWFTTLCSKPKEVRYLCAGHSLEWITFPGVPTKYSGRKYNFFCSVY